MIGMVLKAQEQSRALRLVIKDQGVEEKITLYEKSYALVIGNSEYKNRWSVLPGVKKDVPEVSKALREHGFEVRILEDLDAEGMTREIKKFISDEN